MVVGISAINSITSKTQEVVPFLEATGLLLLGGSPSFLLEINDANGCFVGSLCQVPPDFMT